MKNKNLSLKMFRSILLTLLFSSLLFACKKNEGPKTSALDASKLTSVCDAGIATAKTASISEGASLPYTVSLLAHNKPAENDTYIWIWSVNNPNPGNGSNGTAQDLSHWGISLGLCATLDNVVSAAISHDGVNWTPFTPSYKKDKSQDCYQQPVLKFDEGTNGNKTTYYKLVLNKKFIVEKVDALYKSGSKTGCGTFKICGIGDCEDGGNTTEGPDCDDRPTLQSNFGTHNVNSGSKEYYRGSTILGSLNVNDLFDFCGSLIVYNDVIVNSNGYLGITGSLTIGKNLTINSNSKVKIKGAAIITGNLTLHGTIEFTPGSSLIVGGTVTKSPGATVIGTPAGTAL